MSWYDQGAGVNVSVQKAKGDDTMPVPDFRSADSSVVMYVGEGWRVTIGSARCRS